MEPLIIKPDGTYYLYGFVPADQPKDLEFHLCSLKGSRVETMVLDEAKQKIIYTKDIDYMVRA
jgi:hypothetical protein